MKYFINLLILPLILSLWGGVSPAEGKVCFIIDPDGKCASGKVEKFQQDCSARGYTKSCTDNGQVGVGDSCDGKYKKCQCKGEYQYSKQNSEAGKYNFYDACTVDGVTKYKYMTCQSKYKYAVSAIPADAASHILAATVCETPAMLGDDVCTEDMYAGGKDRSPTCTCPSNYKYTQADEKSGKIVVGGTTCTDSSGTHYTSLSCANGYTRGSCPDNGGWISSDVTESNDKTLTCVKCTAKTCASEEYDTPTPRMCSRGYKLVTGTITSGNTTTQCAKCEKITSCEGYEGYQTEACGAGYKQTSENKYIFPSGVSFGNGTSATSTTCYQCTAYTCATRPEGYEGQCSSRVSKVLPLCRSINLCPEGYEAQLTSNVQLGSSTGTCYKCVESKKTCEDQASSSVQYVDLKRTTIAGGVTDSDGNQCYLHPSCVKGDIIKNVFGGTGIKYCLPISSITRGEVTKSDGIVVSISNGKYGVISLSPYNTEEEATNGASGVSSLNEAEIYRKNGLLSGKYSLPPKSVIESAQTYLNTAMVKLRSVDGVEGAIKQGPMSFMLPSYDSNMKPQKGTFRGFQAREGTNVDEVDGEDVFLSAYHTIGFWVNNSKATTSTALTQLCYYEGGTLKCLVPGRPDVRHCELVDTARYKCYKTTFNQSSGTYKYNNRDIQGVGCDSNDTLIAYFSKDGSVTGSYTSKNEYVSVVTRICIPHAYLCMGSLDQVGESELMDTPKFEETCTGGEYSDIYHSKVTIFGNDPTDYMNYALWNISSVTPADYEDMISGTYTGFYNYKKPQLGFLYMYIELQ